MNEELIRDVLEAANNKRAVLYGTRGAGMPVFTVGEDGKLCGTQWQGQDMDNAIDWAKKGMLGCYVINPCDSSIDDVDYYPNE